MEPVKPAVTLLKEVGEAGQHNDFTEEIGVRVITVAEGHDKSQPSGCLLDGQDIFETMIQSPNHEPNIWTGVAMGHNRHHKIRMNVDFVAGQLKFQVYLAQDQYDITAAGILINKLYEKLEYYGGYLKEMDSKLGKSNTEKHGAAWHE